MPANHSKEEILKFLRSVSIMSLAISADPYPVATILLFSVDDDFTFYFATRNSSHKAKALMQTSKVSLSVWEHNQILVQAHGDTSQATEPKEIDEILEKLASSVSDLSDSRKGIIRGDQRGSNDVRRNQLLSFRQTNGVYVGYVLILQATVFVPIGPTSHDKP